MLILPRTTYYADPTQRRCESLPRSIDQLRGGGSDRRDDQPTSARLLLAHTQLASIRQSRACQHGFAGCSARIVDLHPRRNRSYILKFVRIGHSCARPNA